jgi:uncharacterized SAM-dependent methyltransferase
MHLMSNVDQSASIGARYFAFRAGETIHTENCHKYTVGGFSTLAAQAGWSVEESWQSDSPEFAILLLA